MHRLSSQQNLDTTWSLQLKGSVLCTISNNTMGILKNEREPRTENLISNEIKTLKNRVQVDADMHLWITFSAVHSFIAIHVDVTHQYSVKQLLVTSNGGG